MENSIFHGQPSFHTFDKPFEDNKDALYLLLNELDPGIVTQDTRPYEHHLLLDPRTNEPVTQVVYDRSKPKRWNIFHSPQRSCLNRVEHEACLRAIIGLAQRQSVEEEDLLIWRRTTKRREKEKILMQNFVQEYAQQHKEKLFASMKLMVDDYRLWYLRRATQLLQELPDSTFITHLGLPKVQYCTTLNDNSATIEEITLVERKGSIMMCHSEAMAELYKCGDIVHKWLEQHVCVNAEPLELRQPQPQSQPLENDTFVLPMESLLFLLTTGDYIDLPTEMLLEINGDLNDEFKWLKFHLPLPSRNCGWHTNSELVQRAFDAYLSAPGRTKYLNVSNADVTLEELRQPPEIIGCTQDSSEEYRLHLFDDYMVNVLQNKTLQNDENLCKSNCALISWKLRSSDSDMKCFNFLTTLQIPAALDAKGDNLVGCNFIKLENKPQFGCEAMTKYELMKAWLQLKLLQSDFGQCIRLELETFHLLCCQQFTLEDVGRFLQQHYRINIDMLFGKLMEFLKMLLTVAAGKYLLRFNSKYSDKIMLCAQSQENSQNAVRLHTLLQTPPTDFVFMGQSSYLPIDTDLCSAMHMQHQILPGAFPTNKRFIKTPRMPVNNKLKNERQMILDKASSRKEVLKKLVRKNKKKRSRARKAKAKCEQEKKDNDDVELDKIFTL